MVMENHGNGGKGVPRWRIDAETMAFQRRMSPVHAKLSCDQSGEASYDCVRRLADAIGISTILGVALAAQTPPPLFIYTHTAERARYLANAIIWRDPGPLTPDDIRRGPKASIPEAIAKAGDQPIECRYDRPGADLGGKTPKFSCRTSDGKTVRVKYYGGDGGNREVFAELAAGRHDVGTRIRFRSDVSRRDLVSRLPGGSLARLGRAPDPALFRELRAALRGDHHHVHAKTSIRAGRSASWTARSTACPPVHCARGSGCISMR